MITHVSHQFRIQADSPLRDADRPAKALIHDLESEVDTWLSDMQLQDLVARSSSVLVQIFSADTHREHLRMLSAWVSNRIPRAVIVGATTVGEISEGRLLTGSTVIGVTCFEQSDVSVIAMSCHEKDVFEAGAELGRRVNLCSGSIVGVLLLATPLSIDASGLLAGIDSTLGEYPVFGGGAGDYAAMTHSMVFTADEYLSQGAVAVVFTGDDLHIESGTYLGWRPLSKTMRVTEVENLVVKTVDDKPAFEVYRRYLNIPNDDRFFLNALEFPFLLERNGEMIARVPVAVTGEGALQFIADIREGECFRIGYGDMDLIVSDAFQIHQAFAQFSPQAIFLYTCGCRRFLMQDAVDLETEPFESLAPSFGFYTYGEFFSSNSLQLLNSTMVVVGLREGPATQGIKPASANQGIKEHAADPYANKHTRVVSRLMRFIGAVTAELEASNREITALSRTDRLTQLVNRTELDQVLEENLTRALRYNTPFSIVLLDLDHFKEVNDIHGHLVGDDVLVNIARILTENTRSMGTVGRWGGEEFLIVMPDAELNDARLFAEKLRGEIENRHFPVIGKMTASFGVTAFEQDDDVVRMIKRADVSLYVAKHSGRNRVETAQSGAGSK